MLNKSPFCIHTKTGKLCVSFDSKDIMTFDPFNVPTLNSMKEEYRLYKGFFFNYIDITDDELFI